MEVLVCLNSIRFRIDVIGLIVFLMTLTDHFNSSLVKDEGHRLIEKIREAFKILLVDVNLVLFVIKRAIFLSKFFTFSDGEIVIARFCFSYIEKVGSSSCSEYF